MASIFYMEIILNFFKKPIDIFGNHVIIQKLSDTATEYGGIAQLGERLNGIQEVSGSIPLISTRKTLKTIGFQGFFLFSGNFSCGGGNFLTQV